MNKDKKNIYQCSKTMSNFNIANKPYLTQKRANPQYYAEKYQLVKTSPKNNLAPLYNKVLKQKMNRGILDTGSLGNKNIIIDSDSDQFQSNQNNQKKPVNKKNATNLYVTKTESKYPKLKDGLIKGYYIKNENPNKEFFENDSLEIGNFSNMINMQDENYSRREENGVPAYGKNIGDGYMKSYYLKKTIPVNKKNLPYFKPKKFPNGDIKNKNKTINNNPRCSMENPSPIFLNNSNNILSEEYFNQTYFQNPLMKTTESIDYDANDANNENSSYYNNIDYNRNTKSIIINKPNCYNRVGRYAEMTTDSKNSKKPKLSISRKKQKKNNDVGGIVNLNYGLRNLHNESAEYENDENENAKIIQDFIRNSYKKDICAAKIQALWRGVNTRKIVNLYNDLDEFVYHISKVKFDRFRDDFYFFINQLFNKYEENIMNDISKENGGNEENLNNNDDDTYQNKNEVNLFLGKNEDDKENNLEELQKKYDELFEKYNDLLNSNNSKRKQTKKSNDVTTMGFESTNGSIHSNYKFKKNNILTDKNTNDNLTFSNDYDADLDINYMSNQEEDLKNNDNDNYYLRHNKFSYSTINNNSNENSKYFDNENPKAKKNLKQNNERYNTGFNNVRRKNYKLYTSNSPSVEKSRNFSSIRRTPEKNISINIISMSKQNPNDYLNNSGYDKYLENFKKNLCIQKNVELDVDKLDKDENKVCGNKGFTLLSEYCYEEDDGYYYDNKQKKIIEKTKEVNKVITKYKEAPRNFDQNKIFPENENYLEFIKPKKSINQMTKEILDNKKLIENIEKELNALKPIFKPKILKQNSFAITKSKKIVLKDLPKLISEIETNINNLQIIQNIHRNFSPSKLDFDNNDLFIGENAKLLKKQKLKKLKNSNEVNLNINNIKTSPLFFNSSKTIPSEIENNFTIYTKKIKPKNLITRIKPINIKKTKKAKSPRKFDENEFKIEKIKKNSISVTKPKIKAKPKRIKIDKNTKFEIPKSYEKPIIKNDTPKYINEFAILKPECRESITINHEYEYILDVNRSPVDAFTSPLKDIITKDDLLKNKRPIKNNLQNSSTQKSENKINDITKENDIELLGNVKKDNILYHTETLELSVIDKKKKKKSKINKNDNFIINAIPKKWNINKDLNPEQYVSNLHIIKTKQKNINKPKEIPELFIEDNELEIKGIRKKVNKIPEAQHKKIKNLEPENQKNNQFTVKKTKKILNENETEITNELNKIEPTPNEEFSIEKPENIIHLKSKSLKNIIDHEEESENKFNKLLQDNETQITNELNNFNSIQNDKFSIQKLQKEKEPLYIENNELSIKAQKKKENQTNNQYTITKTKIVIYEDETDTIDEMSKTEPYKKSELKSKPKKVILEPENQLNNQFTVEKKEKEKPIIIQNGEFSLIHENNKQSLPSIIAKIQENELTIKRKRKPILQKENQLNNQFTVDKTPKQVTPLDEINPKSETKENVLTPSEQLNNKFSIKKTKKHSNKNETEITDDLNTIEKISNEEFSINKTNKNIPLYIEKENELNIKKIAKVNKEDKLFNNNKTSLENDICLKGVPKQFITEKEKIEDIHVLSDNTNNKLREAKKIKEPLEILNENNVEITGKTKENASTDKKEIILSPDEQINNKFTIKKNKKQLEDNETEITDELNVMEPTLNEEFSIEKSYKKPQLRSKPNKNILQPENQQNNQFTVENTKQPEKQTIIEPSQNEEFALLRPNKEPISLEKTIENDINIQSIPKEQKVSKFEPLYQINDQFTLSKNKNSNNKDSETQITKELNNLEPAQSEKISYEKTQNKEKENQKPETKENETQYDIENETKKEYNITNENQLKIKSKIKPKTEKQTETTPELLLSPEKLKNNLEISKVENINLLSLEKENPEYEMCYLDGLSVLQNKDLYLIKDKNITQFSIKSKKPDLVINKKNRINLLSNKTQNDISQKNPLEKISLDHYSIMANKKEVKEITVRKKKTIVKSFNCKKGFKDLEVDNENNIELIPKEKQKIILENTPTEKYSILANKKDFVDMSSQVENETEISKEKPKIILENTPSEKYSILANKKDYNEMASQVENESELSKEKPKIILENTPSEKYTILVNKKDYNEMASQVEKETPSFESSKNNLEILGKEKKFDKNVFPENSNEVYYPPKPKSPLETTKNENFKISKNKKHLNETETETDEYLSIPNGKIEVNYTPKLKIKPENIIDSNVNNLEIIVKKPEKTRKILLTTSKKLIKSKYIKSKNASVDFDKCSEFEILSNTDNVNSSRFSELIEPYHIELQNSINVLGVKKKKMKKKRKTEPKKDEEISPPIEKLEACTDTINLNPPYLINKENDFNIIQEKDKTQNELLNKSEINLEFLHEKKKKKLKKKKDKTLEESKPKIIPILEMWNPIQLEYIPMNKDAKPILRNVIITTINPERNKALEKLCKKIGTNIQVKKIFNDWKNLSEKKNKDENEDNENILVENNENILDENNNNNTNEIKDDNDKITKIQNNFRQNLKTRMKIYRIEKLKSFFLIFNNKEIPVKQFIYLNKWKKLSEIELNDDQISEQIEKEIPKDDIRYILDKYEIIFWKKFMGEFVDEYAKILTYSSGFDILNNVILGNLFNKLKENTLQKKPQKKERKKRNSRVYEKQKLGLEKLKSVLRKNEARYFFMDRKLRKLRLLMIRFALNNKN